MFTAIVSATGQLWLSTTRMANIDIARRVAGKALPPVRVVGKARALPRARIVGNARALLRMSSNGWSRTK
jgi:hypothetical protein